MSGLEMSKSGTPRPPASPTLAQKGEEAPQPSRWRPLVSLDAQLPLKELRQTAEWLFDRERATHPDPHHLRRQRHVTAPMRRILVNWLADICCEQGYARDTLHLAVNLVDRFLARNPTAPASSSSPPLSRAPQPSASPSLSSPSLSLSSSLSPSSSSCLLPNVAPSAPAAVAGGFGWVESDDEDSDGAVEPAVVQRRRRRQRHFERELGARTASGALLVTSKNYQLVGLVALFVAHKLEEVAPLEMDELVALADDVFRRHEVYAMERVLLQTLGWDLLAPTAPGWLEPLGRLVGLHCTPLELLDLGALLDTVALDPTFLAFYPSAQAAAALALRFVYQRQWVAAAALEDATGYTLDDLAPCVAMMHLIEARLEPRAATLERALRSAVRAQLDAVDACQLVLHDAGALAALEQLAAADTLGATLASITSHRLLVERFWPHLLVPQSPAPGLPNTINAPSLLHPASLGSSVSFPLPLGPSPASTKANKRTSTPLELPKPLAFAFAPNSRPTLPALAPASRRPTRTLQSSPSRRTVPSKRRRL